MKKKISSHKMVLSRAHHWKTKSKAATNYHLKAHIMAMIKTAVNNKCKRGLGKNRTLLCLCSK